MSMDFQWHSPSVVHVRYLGKVESWDQYHQVNEAVVAAIKERRLTATRSTGEFYIIHTPGRVAMPKGSPLPHLRRVSQIMPPQVTIYAVVENYFAKLMMELVLNALAAVELAPKLYFASSFQAALKQIGQQQVAR